MAGEAMNWQQAMLVFFGLMLAVSLAGYLIAKTRARRFTFIPPQNLDRANQFYVVGKDAKKL
jgi:hypothetical protein